MEPLEKSKQKVSLVKDLAKTRSIEREANIAAWNDYIGFGVSKLVGLAGFIVGGIEFLDPGFLSIVLPNPGWIAGAGFAILTGKNVITLIAKLEKVIK